MPPVSPLGGFFLEATWIPIGNRILSVRLMHVGLQCEVGPMTLMCGVAGSGMCQRHV